MAIASAKKFLREIAQPFDFLGQVGTLLLTEENLKQRQDATLAMETEELPIT